MDETSEEELTFIRAQYAGKLTMVDRWLGELLDMLDHLTLWDNTAVIVITDHGHDLGQRGVFGKQWTHYDSHGNIPLLMWHPAYPRHGEAVNALTSTVDLFATILEVMGAPVVEGTHSKSFLPVLAGECSTQREALLYGTFGQGVACTNGLWTLLKSPEQDEPLFSYSTAIFHSLVAEHVNQPVSQGYFIPGVALPQWKIPITRAQEPLGCENLLFHRTADPEQKQNLWDENLDERQRMLTVLQALLTQEGTPLEQYERLGLDLSLRDS